MLYQLSYKAISLDIVRPGGGGCRPRVFERKSRVERMKKKWVTVHKEASDAVFPCTYKIHPE